MRITTFCRCLMIPAIVASALAGCSGSGTTVDNGPPTTGTPLTTESLKATADEINAQGKGMAPAGAPKK